ncbi:MAG: FAD-dependent thymidylate synthase [Gammaproteobacteria bacterium]|nr:FAD-dependent thymidylate synthase [Gammaproteobacteria bacterium]
MKVELQAVTPNAESNIVEIARVSSSRKDKKAKPEGLINYLIKHKHFSPFEHSYLTLEIETSKAIGIQLIRHRSFTFQEFSQRYQDVNALDDIFEPIELRKQCEDNRQSSTEVFNPTITLDDTSPANEVITSLLGKIKSTYKRLLEAGVAREQARMILPMTTKTKIFMTGSIRSWIHFINLRDDEHAQKEIQLVAKGAKKVFTEQFPIISSALDY